MSSATHSLPLKCFGLRRHRWQVMIGKSMRSSGEWSRCMVCDLRRIKVGHKTTYDTFHLNRRSDGQNYQETVG